MTSAPVSATGRMTTRAHHGEPSEPYFPPSCGHPPMGGPMPRMNHPRLPMNPNYGGVRPPPNSSMGAGGIPMSMAGPGGPPGGPGGPGGPGPAGPGGPRGPWPNASTGPGGGGPPGTPIMPSPQESTNSGDNMYAIMKPIPGPGGGGGGMGPGNFPMGSGPDGPMPMGGQDIPPVINSDMDGMPKSSPASDQPGGGPGTPREDNGDMSGQLFPPFQDNDQNESAAILKIKETMQEEAKRFEKDTPSDHPDYFMQ